MGDKRIIVIEDDLQYAGIIELLISKVSGFQLRAVFNSYQEWKLAEFPVADIFLLDIGLPDANGLDLIEQILDYKVDASIIMITVFDDESKLFEAISNGANGYILKNEIEYRLEQALQEVSMGGMTFSASMATLVSKYFRRNKRKSSGKLSKREIEILEEFKNGLTKKEIAIQLNIGYTTVESHIKSIYHKLHVKNGVQAVVKAHKEGLLEL